MCVLLYIIKYTKYTNIYYVNNYYQMINHLTALV